MQLAALVTAVQDFLVASRNAVVVEDGAVLSDLTRAKYSLSAEHGKCVLHLWSEERNAVRRVVDAEAKGPALRLAVLRMGQAKPSRTEILRERDRRTHPLWRLPPERWLETSMLEDVSAVDQRLDPQAYYSQMPAFSRSDRVMMDVLSVTRNGRLAVIEPKAEEDLPLQGIDYWARVAWHQARGEFQRFGYFPGRELAAQAPLLLLVAPALHVHPATDTLLRYLSPEIG